MANDDWSEMTQNHCSPANARKITVVSPPHLTTLPRPANGPTPMPKHLTTPSYSPRLARLLARRLLLAVRQVDSRSPPGRPRIEPRARVGDHTKTARWRSASRVQTKNGCRRPATRPHGLARRPDCLLARVGFDLPCESPDSVCETAPADRDILGPADGGLSEPHAASRDSGEVLSVSADGAPARPLSQASYGTSCRPRPLSTATTSSGVPTSHCT